MPGAERSALTAFGRGLIDEIEAMGVEVRYAINGDEQRLLEVSNARAVINFWGDSPQDTQILLREDANNATVYEEYLHALEGQKRGWTSVRDSIERLTEEMRVGRQVLTRADELGMTTHERAEVERTIQSYLKMLRIQVVDAPLQDQDNEQTR